MVNKITNYLKQEDSKLICVKKCTITLDMSDYEKGNNIRIDEDKIWVKSLVSEIEFDDIMFKLILDYSVNIEINKIEKTKEFIKLTYEPNDIILGTITEANQMKGQVQYIERLISGNEVYKDVDHFLMKLFKIYGPISDMDLVHLEVLASQMLRDKSDTTLPARLGKIWNPTLINMKKVVFNSGFINGLCFENINEAIKTGLLGGETLEPSIIEKVLTGTLVEEKK